MPPRSYIQPTDFRHAEKILTQAVGELTTEQIYRFTDNNIAPIIDEAALSHLLKVPNEYIFSLITRPEKHYRSFYILQENGKRRRIDAPRTYLKVIQWWILDNIVGRVVLPDCVHGFVQKRSSFSNAAVHNGAKHILNIDIKNFFPSISEVKAREVFERLGYSFNVARQLSALTTYKGRLPQGAPTSPSIANIAFMDIDYEILDFAKKNSLTYTRYADDLSFSSKSWIDKRILRQISDIIKGNGFTLNNKKTRFAGPGDRLEITGLAINDKIQPPRDYRRRVRALFNNAKLDPNQYAASVKVLEGHLALASMTDQHVPRQWRRTIERLKGN